MKKISFLLFGILFSCNSNTTEIKKHFINLKEDEFWGLYSNSDCFKFNGHYVKFYDNDEYKDFQWDNQGNINETNIYEKKKWNITKDSILSYNYRFKYKIVLINDGAILVSAGDGITFMFIKENRNHIRKPEWQLHKDSLKLNNPNNL